ncbi:MAG: iron uptake porin, partial [Nostoc sp.]
MSNFRWNYRSILFLLSLLDILAILVFYPAKSQAELPKSNVSTPEVEVNKAPEGVVNQTVETSIAPVTRKKRTNDLRDQVTSVSQLSDVKLPTNKKAPNNPAGQVTSVSQLSDVKPTDWAFQALQSLVERYGAIAGYTDGTFKGDRSLTRYEFAAGLSAALDRLNELIGTSTTDLV